MISVAVKKCTGQKLLFCFSLHFQVRAHHCGGQGRNSKQLVTSHPHSRHHTSHPCSLIYLYSAQCLTLTQLQTLYLGNGASYSGLSHPTSINLIDTVFYRLTHCRQSSIKTHFPGNARLCSANKPKNTFLLRSEVLRLESLHLHSIWNTSFAQ